MKVGPRAQDRVRKARVGSVPCANRTSQRGYAVKFHVLAETRWAEYLRPGVAFGKSKVRMLSEIPSIPE